MFKLSKNSINNMAGIDPDLVRVIELAIKITKIDFGVGKDGGMRTAKRQNELFRTEKSERDGYVRISRHQSGEAVDVYAYIDGKGSWREDHLAMVYCAILQAASMLKVPVNWGGLWSSKKKTNGISYGWDMAHVELQ